MKKTMMWLAALLTFSLSALAAVVTINLSNHPYSGLSMVPGQNIYSEAEVKMGIGFEVVKLYNQLNSNSKLGNGDQAKIVYQDGSSERYAVGSLMSSSGVLPIPGTQQLASSGSGGGPYDDGGDGGLGGTPYENCMVDRVTGCVAVGESETECNTFSVLNCPP